MTAEAIKISRMPFDFTIIVCLGGFGDFFCERQVKVGNAAAPRTDEMVMGRGIEIKTVNSVPHPEPDNFAKVGKQGQVPVDSSKADVGEGFPDIHVNHICGGMVFPERKEFFDGIPLFAMF